MFMYRVVAELGFYDGSVYPKRLKAGEYVVVDEQTYLKMRESDPESIQLIEKVLPNPRKAPANAKP